MANNVARADPVALDDVLEQNDQGLDLGLAVGIPEAPGGRVDKARIDDFDADGTGIEPGSAFPFTFPGVPGASAFIYQFVDGRAFIVADQVMGTDLAMGQQGQGTLQEAEV